jgi:hypothetical protein
VYSTDTPDATIFDKLPTWIQDKIANRIIDAPKAAPKAAAKPAATEEAFADDSLAF